MTVIGLTGPSGSGKGKVASLMSEYGVQHIDADVVYHNMLKPPSECLDELVLTFGERILTPSGKLDRKKLALLVFGQGNEEKLKRLNSITHKYVCSRIRQIIKYYQDLGHKACVVDAPLLFEAGFDSECDFVICVIADTDTRVGRISARDNITCDQAMLRISSQKPDEFYIERSDHVLYNNGTEESLRSDVCSLMTEKGIGGVT